MTNKIREVLGMDIVTPKQVNTWNNPPANLGNQKKQTLNNEPPLGINQMVGILEQSQKAMLENMRQMLQQCFQR